ncbi:hypothetical protein IMZ48_44615 [Candidatus Bathyarchaeota archaeon]|nr:hypothetical protein [Candidatus Bathyarchaeota archaeon]
MDLDEFEDVEVEDELHIIVPVRDFRAVVQHAGSAGTELSTRYSHPGQPIKVWYAGDAMHCDFLLMTVGERGNPGQKMRRQRGAKRSVAPELEAASRRGSAPPSERAASVGRPTPQPSVARPSVQKRGYFEMRPSQAPPPPSRMMSDSLFVAGDDDEWAPVRDDEEEEEEDARLEWDGTDRNVSLEASGGASCCSAANLLSRRTNLTKTERRQVRGSIPPLRVRTRTRVSSRHKGCQMQGGSVCSTTGRHTKPTVILPLQKFLAFGAAREPSWRCGVFFLHF